MKKFAAFLSKPGVILILWQVLFFGGIFIGSVDGITKWWLPKLIIMLLWFGLAVFWAFAKQGGHWPTLKK